MRKSRLSRSKQARLREHFVAGTTARCAAALIGINSKTAIYYFHRLRILISDQLEQEEDIAFGSEIEVDESYFGGKCKEAARTGCGKKSPDIRVVEAGWQSLHEDYSRCFFFNFIPYH